VAAGAVVATLAPALPSMQDERTRREQLARVETARAMVERAQSRAERARVAVDQAGADLRRSEQLAPQGFVAPTRLETDRLALRAAERELDTANADRRVAAQELEQARAALTAVAPHQAAARDFAVRAPAAGRVLRVVQNSEAAVGLGTPIMEIGDVARMEVVAELLTADALQALPGTPVRIERWGGPGTLAGRVRLVEPSAFTKVSALGVEEQRVLVRIDLESPAEQWRALGDGFRVGVRIIVLALDAAVQVPVSAVYPLPDADGPRAHGVFVLDGGRAREAPVELGARNGTHAWIKQGLDPGTPVVVYPPATLADGARVKPRKAN
jgi:HlyD family secretion protein